MSPYDPTQAPPPPDPGIDWVCRGPHATFTGCGVTNSGARTICRNCGRLRTKSSPVVQAYCPSCGVTGRRVPLLDAKTPRGSVRVCGTCGDEYERVPQGDPPKLVHRLRTFSP